MLKRQQGWSLIEVLITLLVLMIGLLGMAGLLVHAQRAEFESFQRKQAMIMIQDISDRISANRNSASCYAFGNSAGSLWLGSDASASAPTCIAGTATQIARVASDLAAWDATLQGGAEVLGSGAGSRKVGTALNARGCVVNMGTVNDASGNPLYTEYAVSVAWQSLVPIVLPASAPTCGKDSYDSADALRRVVSLTLRVPVLG